MNISVQLKRTFFYFTLSLLSIYSYAQPPVTNGLNLYLDNAAVNFTPASGSTTPAKWKDNSGSGNDMIGFSAATSPTYVSTPFPGVAFNGVDQRMQNVTLNSSFSNTSATIFVVRISTPAESTGWPYRCLLNIPEDGAWNNEFSCDNGQIFHQNSSGNYVELKHQCYDDIPDDKPAIITGTYSGTTATDINFLVNGIASTQATTVVGAPSNYTANDRRIYLGFRIYASHGYIPDWFFKGTIFEVLAYNRVLTATEIEQVSNYLKCKYNIDYTTCNVPSDCGTTGNNDCPDSCYWTVHGNNIRANNIFGTLTNSDVRIQTNSLDRGIITRDGLIGWNTTTPTAYLHVNCEGNNQGNDGRLSDIRFEKLESGTGNILVINKDGYVMNSSVSVAELQNLKDENEQLKAEVEALKTKVDELIDCCHHTSGQAEITKGNVNNKLYQNTPNPFNENTSIGFNIQQMDHSAVLAIYDIHGKELSRYAINKRGAGAITIHAGSLSSGTYLYTLIVDGIKVDTKKMVLTK